MDEAEVDNASVTGGKARRAIVAPGEADSTGRTQTWEADGSQFRAHVHDTAAIAELATIKGHVDAVETKLDTLITHVDGLETELAQKTEPADTQIVSGVVAVSNQPSQPLTDAQLRAFAVPVSGPLTDAQLRASPLALPTGAATEASLARRHNLFASLAKAEAEVGQELRFDDVTGGDLFIGRAASAASTGSAVWEIVKYTRDAAGKVQRAQYRTNVSWDDRTAGW